MTILALGEILLDCFPGYSRIGGAPFNFAYHLKKFGLPVRFISRIGRDESGRNITGFLSRAGFDPADLQIDADRPTGRVDITLDPLGGARYSIVPDVAYDLLSFDRIAAEIRPAPPPRLIYFGSLIQRTRHGFEGLHRLLSESPRSLCLYDMNLRPGATSETIVQTSLESADILKLNEAELERTAAFFGRDATAPEMVEWLMARFSLSAVSLTRGADGSVLYTARGRLETPAAPVGALVDTVGAGDAYCAVLAAGLLLNWPADRILREADAFSSRICAIPGAVPESDDLYREIQSHLEGSDHVP